MMKKSYTEPVVKVVRFSCGDILLASDTDMDAGLLTGNSQKFTVKDSTNTDRFGN